jgi:hypothetical protein
LYGFRAAAVTVMDMVAAGAPRPPKYRGLWRSIELRFARPFAAVAALADNRGGPEWTGLPVFSAWISEPCEPAETCINASRTASVEPIDPATAEQLTLAFPETRQKPPH